jgi:malonyl-CoA O-methyltransferase
MDPAAALRWAQRPLPVSPWLHEEVGLRMAERLAWIKQRPNSWLDWEPVAGGETVHHAVRQALPDAKEWVASARPAHALSRLDARSAGTPSWWAKLRGRTPVVATPDARVGLVWANMALHASHLPQSLLQRWHQHLETDGFVMFSCLGPDSLKELSAVYARMGWPAPSHAFTDMHDWGDMLVHTGFAEPVMDAETITLTYSSVDTLLADLRTLGRNLHAQRAVRTRGRGWLAQLHQALRTHLPRTPEGQMRLSFEVVYGHAYKPKPRPKVSATSAVSLRDMREMLGTSKPLPKP